MSFSSLIGRAVFSQKDSARLAKAYFDGLSTLNSSSLYVFTVLIPMHELISMQKAASRHRGIFITATQAYGDGSRRQKCHKLTPGGLPLASDQNTGSCRVCNQPLSPPCIPPKFVLHGLSARNKFLAVSGLNHHVHLHRYPLLR